MLYSVLYTIQTEPQYSGLVYILTLPRRGCAQSEEGIHMLHMIQTEPLVSGLPSTVTIPGRRCAVH